MTSLPVATLTGMSMRPRILLAVLLAASPGLLVACGGDTEVAAPVAEEGTVLKIDSAEGAALIDSDRSVLVVDVRRLDEYRAGHLVGAQHIPVEDPELWEQRTAALDPERPVVVYCRTGRRSAIAAEQLVAAGFSEVYDLGGETDWDPADLEIES